MVKGRHFSETSKIMAFGRNGGAVIEDYFGTSERGMIMKPTKLLLFVLIILAALSIEGCAPKGELWSVDFTDYLNEDLSDWNDQIYLSPQGYLHNETGLYFDSHILTAPYGFNGDFILTLLFTLDTGVDDVILNMELGLTDGSFEPGGLGDEEYLLAEFINIGDEDMDSWALRDDGYIMDMDFAINGIDITGPNELVLAKKGSNVKLTLNDKPVGEMDYEDCTLEYFVPYIYLNTSALKQIRLKSISVQYEGDMQPR